MALTTEELVYVTTEDGVTLEGIVIRPAEGTPQPVAIAWMHGLTGKFYGRVGIAIGRLLAGRGFVFVAGNNRGHDFGFVLPTPRTSSGPGDPTRTASGQVRLGGGGWELFSESPYDMAAWVTFAAGLAERGVLLAGHSLGALKVGYYQAQRNDPRVLGVAACSPPGGASRLDPALLAQAERMVAEGRGQDLLPWGSRPTGAGTHSAQTYLDRAKTSLDVYGVNGSMRYVTQIRCPLFACLGSEEPTVGTAEDLETIRRNAVNAPRVETRLFQGADHSYAGHEEEVAETLATWASSLV